MGRYNGEREGRSRPYFIDIALGIIVAGVVTTLVEFTIGLGTFTLLMNAIMPKPAKSQYLATNASYIKPYPINAIGNIGQAELALKHDILQQTMKMQKDLIQSLPKTREQISRENGVKAYAQAKNEVANFKAQYVKPEECYNMKDQKTRIFCANHFMRAKREWEKANLIATK
jgi:hypothetical protein